MPNYSTAYLIRLRKGIIDCFSLGEFNLLASDIDVDPESLAGETKPEKAHSLIAYLNRRGELKKLIEICAEQRPKNVWHDSQITEREDDLLHKSWPNFDPELQSAIAIAFNQAKQEGANTIKTRYLFAALVRLRPGTLTELLDEIPEAGMPKPISEDISDGRNLLMNEPVNLSGCIADSLSHLAPLATSEDQLTSTEMFVDIAKFGTGNSVSKLRKAGVTPEVVDQLVDEHHIVLSKQRPNNLWIDQVAIS